MATIKQYKVYWRNPETRKFEALPNAVVWTDDAGQPDTIDGRPQDHIKRQIAGLQFISINLKEGWWE